MHTDIRSGLRQLRKSPGFTFVAVVTLALGIGVNTAIFSIINTVLLSPLPYANADRILTLWETYPTPNGRGNGTLCIPRLHTWQHRLTSFDGIGAWQGIGLFLKTADRNERLNAVAVTSEVLPLLGVQPLYGRFFTREEDEAGRNNVAIMSYALWKRRFSGDPAVLNRIVKLDSGPATVIGIMPEGFTFPLGSTNGLWVPLALPPTENENHSMHTYQTVGKVKAGVTTAEAIAELETLTSNLETGDKREARGVAVIPMRDLFANPVSNTLWLYFGVVGLVLFIACANVANLLLARASGRRAELSIRAAIGASRGRLVSQLFTESLLLALAGAALGLLATYWVLDLIKLNPAVNLPRLREVAIDLRVLLFCSFTAGISAIVFGLIPAWQATRNNLHDALRDASRTGGSQSRSPLRSVLVVVEVALTLILLVGAGLLTRSLLRMEQIKPGFQPENTVVMKLTLPAARYKDNEAETIFFDRLLEAVRSIPGVAAASVTTHVPPNDYGSNGNFLLAGHPKPSPGEEPFAEFRFIGPGYFEAMRIPLRQGRLFGPEDRAGAPLAVIINEKLSRQFFGKESPIGKQLDFGDARGNIVGVVADFKNRGLTGAPAAELYIPYPQKTWKFRFDMSLVVRGSMDGEALVSAIRGKVTQVDPDQAVYAVRTLEQVLATATATPRFRTILLGSFAALALLLAVIGLYGVVSYDVAQRRQEIGVRIALGARPSHVLKMVVWQGLQLTVTGAVIGLASAFALTRFIKAFLFETAATEPAVYALLTALLFLVAAVAAYIPARRATRIDPITALRYE